VTDNITKDIQGIFKKILDNFAENAKIDEKDDEYTNHELYFDLFIMIYSLWKDSDKLKAESFFITLFNECTRLKEIDLDLSLRSPLVSLFEELFQLGNTHPDYLSIIERIIHYFLNSINSYNKKFVVAILALILHNTSEIKNQDYFKKYSSFITELSNIGLISLVFMEYVLRFDFHRYSSMFIDYSPVFRFHSAYRMRPYHRRKMNIDFIEAFLYRFLAEDSTSNHWMVIEEGIIFTLDIPYIQKSSKIKAADLLVIHGRSRGEIPLLNLLKDEDDSEVKIALLDALGTVGSTMSLKSLITISKTADSRERDKAREVMDKIALKENYQNRFELIDAQKPMKLTFTEIIRTAGLIVSLLGVFVNSLVSRLELIPRDETIIISVISAIVLSIVVLLFVLIIKKRVEIRKFERNPYD